MRVLMIVGGLLAVLSIVFLFGVVQPRADALNSQMMVLGPMAALTGGQAQKELEDMMNAIMIMRIVSIAGISIGGLMFIVGLVRMNSRAKASA